jgi:hypothetical protein
MRCPSVIRIFEAGKERGKLEVDQAEAAVGLSVSYVPYLGIIMPDAIMFQLRKELFGTVFVEMLDTCPAVGCDNLELIRMDLNKPWHERASVAFKMPKDTDFIGKALIGLRPTERLMNTPIVANAHLCPQRILDLVHAGANMAYQKDQASSEASINQLAFTMAK